MRSPFRFWGIAAILFLARAASGQTPSPSPSPLPSPGPGEVAASPAPPPPAVAPSPLPPGATPGQAPAPSGPAPVPVPGAAAAAAEEVHIRADEQGGGRGHYWFQGFVDLRKADIRIQADRLDAYETDQPGGGGTVRKIVAEGNVTFLRGEERISGERLTMDVDTGRGLFEQAFGYVQPGVFMEARTIERVEPNKYHVEGGKFTSCAQPNPRWGFSASSANVDVDDKIVAKNVRFRVKDVPTLYLPYLWYPIREDDRATGFLIPHIGFSSYRGFIVGDSFFWAMGRSMDQTFYADHYSTFGTGLGHEFRYAGESPSLGYFHSYALKPPGSGTVDWDLNWNALEMFPFGIKGSLQVRRFSDLLFQRRIQDSVNLATTRTQRSALSFQKTFKDGTTVRLFADSVDTFFDNGIESTTRLNRHLPSFNVSRSSQQIGRTGFIFGYEAHAEELAQGNQNATNRYSRFDLAPILSRPFSLSFLRITPKTQVRYTRYGAVVDANGDGSTTPSALERRFFESSLEVIGPTFSRVFNNPSGLYGDRFKHTIGPEVTWRYRTRVDNFSEIPKFDGQDQYLGTDQVDYSLVQHFYAKRAVTPGAKPTVYEFLSWSVGQTYYVQIKQQQNQFDPNYSASAFGPGGPSHNSPIQSQIRFRPEPNVATNFNVEYDVNFKQLRSLNLTTAFSGPLGALNAGWSRAQRLSLNPTKRLLTLDTWRADWTLNAVPRALTLNGGFLFDTLTHNLVHASGRLRYEVQCCGFLVEVSQYKFNQVDDRLVRFSIELANIGSLGSFFGTDPTRVYGGNVAYR